MSKNNKVELALVDTPTNTDKPQPDIKSKNYKRKNNKNNNRNTNRPDFRRSIISELLARIFTFNRIAPRRNNRRR